MQNFNEPKLEVISYSEQDIIVSSACDQGMENTGWQCEGDKQVTCSNSMSPLLNS